MPPTTCLGRSLPSPLTNTGITGTRALWITRPTPLCAGRNVYGSSSVFRVPSGCRPTKNPPRRRRAAASSRLARLSAARFRSRKIGRIHREEAHHAVDDGPERMVVEELRADRKQDPVRQPARHELRGGDVEVEERAVVRDEDDAARRVPGREPLDPVHVAEAGRRGPDPPLPHAALERADAGVENARAKARPHQADLRPLQPRERRVAHLEEVVRARPLVGRRVLVDVPLRDTASSLPRASIPWVKRTGA